MSTVDRLALGLIRGLNRDRVRGMSDDEALATFGQAARPIAEALREAIADEVHEQLEARGVRP
jgi:hypothetical protein